MDKKLSSGQRARNIIFAVLITGLLTSSLVGAFARYVTEISGTASITVSKWEVIATDTNTNANTDYDFRYDYQPKNYTASATYSFSVTSNSEVPLSYDVVITSPEVLATDRVKFSLNNSTQDKKFDAVSNDNKTYIIANAGTFTANDPTNTHDLILTITAVNFDEYIEQNDITVQVVATQTQGGAQE